MIRLTRPLLLCTALLTSLVGAQEYELKNGRRIDAASVKANGDAFTATITIGAAQQALNFTAQDLARVSLPEPKALADAREMIANNKLDDAIAAADGVLTSSANIKNVAGAWWYKAMIIKLDATATKGKSTDAVTLIDEATISALAPDAATAVRDMLEIIGGRKGNQDARLTKLRAVTKRSVDSWIQGRAWLEIGDSMSSKGDMESAVKAWLRVPVFFAAEQDLAFRGTLAAAKGMQQIKRAEDGVTLLDQYISDHVGTPYEALIKIEKQKIAPQTDKARPAAENKAP